MTTSELLDMYEEGSALIPWTPEGNQAAYTVKRLVEAVHLCEYCEVPRIMEQIRAIFESFKIFIE